VEAETRVLAAGGTSLRFATLFGVSPRMRLDLLVNDFTFRALRDRAIVLFEGHFRRNYLHVQDAARAFVFAIERNDKMAGQAFNVGLSDANLSKMDLCRLIQRFTPFEIISHETGQDPDQRNYVVSNERIEGLGFRPEHSLEAGIREILRAYPLLRNTGFANA
jgi:nucleoside-diphosphate-sugar epimerase